MEKHDIVVIGAGPGGYPAAIRAAQLGASVALVEKEFLGGACLNWGCIPTKTLIAASSLYHAMSHPNPFGISAEKVAFDYAAMLKNKDQVVGKLRSGIDLLLKANGVTLLAGTASFAGRNRIIVRGGQDGDLTLESGHTIIATGSVADMPEFLPKSPQIVESRAFLNLAQLPKSMLVLGGGIIGCELACMAAQLDVKVTIVELFENILAALDQDVRTVVRRRMETELGIRILTGKPVDSVVVGKAGVTLTVADQTIEADLLLAATGRRPLTQALALDKAGIKANPKGYISVDTWGQTNAATIYAVGDITGGQQLAHAATAQGIAAAEHALGHRRPAGPRVIPISVFTDPEIGFAGLSEQAAKQQQRSVVIGKFQFLALGRALASGESEGFVKWIADANTDQLLGAQAVGAHATELIAEAALAIQAELTTRDIIRTVHAHPTMAEAWMEAAHNLHGECINAPPQRKKILSEVKAYSLNNLMSCKQTNNERQGTQNQQL